MKCLICPNKAQYRQSEHGLFCFKCWFETAEMIFDGWHELWVKGIEPPEDPWVFTKEKIIKG